MSIGSYLDPSDLRSGLFLRWALNMKVAEHPYSSVTLKSAKYGSVTGYVPDNWNGTRVTYAINDEKVGW